ncbi:MAG: hypothetical protein ACEPOW_12905, partial [Bacteroidales bacterium]
NNRIDSLNYTGVLDHSLWDYQLLNDDLENISINTKFPIKKGVFPVPSYESNGVATELFEVMIAGHRFVAVKFGLGRGDYNKHLFPNETNVRIVAVFTLLVKSDEELLNPFLGFSRNHPDYLAEGSFKTASQNIDWLVIQPQNNQGAAIVNMKYFDLSNGRFVMIIPQKDNSFRFMQVPTRFMEFEQIGAFIEKEKKSEEWMKFIQMYAGN